MRRAVPRGRLPEALASGRGLTHAEVERRRAAHGANEILERAGSPWWDLARDTVRDPMLWFLTGTGGLYAALGQRGEAITLLGAIAPLVGMDAVLHRRTQASTGALESRLASRATVVREGSAREVAAVELVPGDLVQVSAGEPFPADGLVTAGEALQADESSLTGEAYPVAKRPVLELPSGPAVPMFEGEHWGFAGTRLLTGRAAMRVVFTGGETLYGEIVRSALHGSQSRTPLQGAVARLVSILVAAAAAVCLLLAGVRLAQGHGWVDALVSSATLAMAALPEEFPMAFTFFLGVGAYRLARRQALVRRAVSVENIGRVTCICSDKTGTLTEGRLRLARLAPAPGVSEEELLAFAAAASRREGGDPLDAALLDALDARGVPALAAERIAVFPFTEDRRRETAIVRAGDGRTLAVTKGAPERIAAMCTGGGASPSWTTEVDTLAAGGRKVIASAWRAIESSPRPATEPAAGYCFAGLIACEDPVREGVADAVARCREAGIHTIMVTGDHPSTAEAVARQIGLGGGRPAVISGEEMEARLRDAGAARVRDVDVIARAVPSQKLALVRALQAANEVVAVTGDGVNDVPALKAADIGIAMGERGTRSAREVAAIVLLDDNFRTIVRAMAEGQQLFRNLRLSYHYLFMIHLPLVSTAALVPLLGYPLLYLPIHLVWLEVLIHPTAMLVFQERPAGDRLDPPARDRRTRFFSGFDWVVMLGVGAFLAAAVLAGFIRSLGAAGDVEHARAMALLTLTGGSAGLAIALGGLRRRAAQVVAAATALLSLALVQLPPLARLMHVRPLHADDLALAAAAALATASLAALARRREAVHVPAKGVRDDDHSRTDLDQRAAA